MQTFIVRRSALINRFDPLMILHSMKRYTGHALFPEVCLSELMLKPPQYGANVSAKEDYDDKHIRYIRITDIDEYGNLKPESWVTAEKIEPQYKLNENDILFARTGATVGKAFIYKNEYGKSIFAGYLIRFVFDFNKVSSYYIFYYTQLSLYKQWVKSIQRPSGQPNINAEEYKSFKIILPSLAIQNQIVDIMDKAYEQKKQKEEEAKRLIDSIDDYILSELGIKVYKVENKKCFKANFFEIKGMRFDAEYHNPKYSVLKHEIENGKYKVCKFVDIIKSLSGGSTPDIKEDNYDEKNNGIPFLRVQNISMEGIDLSDVKYIKRSVHNGELKRSKLKKDDLVFTITGRIGNTAVVPNNFEGNINQHSVRISIKDDIKNTVMPLYLSSYLNTKFARDLTLRETTGTTRPAIDYVAIRKILIPIPPKNLQDQITKEVEHRLDMSFQLKKEAIEVLEIAKAQVEQMLLAK